MKSLTHLHPEAGVYDPSHRRADTASYWQWTNSGLGEQWEQAAEWVNLGWPSSFELKDRSARWYGVMFSDPCDLWVYRVFAAGKDRFGRDERYFFVLIRLRSTEEILNPQIAGLFSYFDAERGLPLKTEPLDHGWQDAAPDEILEAISEEFVRGARIGHWGMDAAGRMTVFSEDKPIPPETQKPVSKQAPPPRSAMPQQAGRKFKTHYVWISTIAVLIILFVFLIPSHRQIYTPPMLSDGTKGPSIETPPTDTLQAPPPTTNSPSKPLGPITDTQQAGKGIDPNPESNPGDKEPPNLDLVPKPKDADGDSPPPAQTPDHPPQPSTGIPENQTKP